MKSHAYCQISIFYDLNENISDMFENVIQL